MTTRNHDAPAALAPYRLVWLALWAEATPQQETELAEHLRAALEPHGTVIVPARGPFPRTPEMLHFEIDLTPNGSAPDCLQALGFTQDKEFGGWNGSWERPVHGGVFLHPTVYGAQAGEMGAATAPRFKTGDVVRVGDSADARELGLAGAEVIVGHPDYEDGTAPAQRAWYYSLHVEGRDETEFLDEADLHPTGRHVQLYGDRITVSPDGSGASRPTPPARTSAPSSGDCRS
ncbi:MBL fold metallo-hydrolase [Streptomyces xanthii]|uniref:Uncharacterized protein n=1 Tax=Streptomyces xanthii TaxID=2768069 RepID=A0A7H1B8L4_9ACTN|nr:hypothetical protein [Streptomyces xanthii]QNS05069.1 hypothetical protein IAG42_16600 [Streptomyces xanthii]